ncbi:MAG TPA: SPW repeat protein [Cytophagaceae bacterium]|jgi:hypothetical protein
MKILSTRIHGVMDYFMGIILIASPWLFGFATGGAEMVIPIVLGVGALLYSIFTDYELGLVRSIPMRTHLMLDVVSGIFLAASPWLFGFSDVVSTPHLVLGILEIGAGLMTSRIPTGCRTC